MKIILYLFVIFNFLSTNQKIFAQYLIDSKVNDDTTTRTQTCPTLSINSLGNFIIAWQDGRNFESGSMLSDIYCQRFNSSGIKNGINIKLTNDSLFLNRPFYLSLRNDKSFVILYLKKYNKIRLFDSTGFPITPLINVNDTINFYLNYGNSNISVDSIGNMYVVWDYIVDIYNSPEIFLQKFDVYGNKIGNCEKVNDDTNHMIAKIKPVITVRRDKSFIIIWRDDRTYPTLNSNSIFMQMYNSSGQKIGQNRMVSDSIYGDINYDNPSISSDSIGNYTVTWEDNRLTGSTYQPWAQNFNASGTKIGNNYRVDQGLSFDKIHSKIAKKSDGNYVIAWSDPTTNVIIPFCRRFNYLNQPIGNQFSIPRQFLNYSKTLFDIKVYNDKIITAWVDYRNANTDIFFNILSFQNPDSIISNISNYNEVLLKNNELYQNYPNPFNLSTIIKYDISKPKNNNYKDKNKNNFVTLKIFDILGREICALINRYQTPGIYEIIFNANNLSSGIYYYSLSINGEFVKNKLMLLLK